MCSKGRALIYDGKTESGAGSMLALSLIFAGLACFGAAQIGASQAFNQARLNSTAEQAAIAADDSLRGLITGFPCEIAKQVALQNMAILDECRIVGFEAFINLHVDSMGIVLNASARAGPSN